MLALAITLPAQAASPSLGSISPRGVQRGVENQMVFSGDRLLDAREIFFYSPGFEVTKLEPAAAAVKATVKVLPTCRLGQHVAQVRTASGVSEYKTFWVGPFGTTPEKEPNSDFASPQPVPMNITVTGVVQNEDVDYYVVEAKKGQRIAADVEGMRLGTTLFDPYVAILDAKRFEMASADDSPLVFQDAVVSAVAPADGRYIVEVRESAYGGNDSCSYRLHIGTFPRPTAVYPAGGQLGQDIEVTFLGDASGAFKQKFNLPAEMWELFEVEPRAGDQVAPSGNRFRLFPHGNNLEVEPNDEIAKATPSELPKAFNGIIEQKSDIDFFKFAAKKGQVFDVECYARRIRSGLDPVMNLYNTDGGGIAGNDDSRGPDSFFRVTIPADGDYLLRVTDHLGRGAKDFVYRVEMTQPKAQLTTSIPRFSQYGQYRQWIVVARGNRFATMINFGRSNFGGDLVLEPKDFPKGITIHAESLKNGRGTLPVVFEADDDAPVAGTLSQLRARHADAKQSISGEYRNNGIFVMGGPGQSVYWSVDVNKVPVCVVDEVPFKLKIVQPTVPIVRNGSMQLKIVAEKKQGWDEAISIQFPFRPPGIGAASSVSIPKEKNEIDYPLSANGGAEIGTWKIYALGSADAGGTAWVSSQLATLEIASQFVTFEMQRAATEQGQSTEVVAKVNHATTFPGEAKVELLGLPNEASTLVMQMTTDTKELVFPVKTTKNTRAGTHKSLFCRVTIIRNGETILHSNVGGTHLRVDKPLPPKKNEPPKPKVVAKKQAPPEPTPKKVVRLTRLQKLRLEARKKREAATNGGSK